MSREQCIFKAKLTNIAFRTSIAIVETSIRPSSPPIAGIHIVRSGLNHSTSHLQSRIPAYFALADTFRHNACAIFPMHGTNLANCGVPYSSE
jgi:hypothetical protein